jgi:hypothetical protein
MDSNHNCTNSFRIDWILKGWISERRHIRYRPDGIDLPHKGVNRYRDFIGTNAWFFLSVNLIKVPFSVGLWLITPQSLWFNSWMVPAIVVGAFLGIRILPLIPQKYFQLIILMFAALGGIRLIFWCRSSQMN